MLYVHVCGSTYSLHYVACYRLSEILFVDIAQLFVVMLQL